MRVVLTGASGQLGAYLVDRPARRGSRGRRPGAGQTPGRRGGLELRPVDLTDAAATEPALDEADPEVIVHAAAMSAAEAVRRDPGAGRAVNVEATAAARRLVRDGATGGWSTPRPTWSSTARGPGTARTTRPSRSSPTAGPSARPSPPCWRVPAGWWPASACCTARRGRAPRPSSTGRSPRSGGASRRRSSRTSSARRSTSPRPPRPWSGWPSPETRAWSTSPAASGSAASS